MKTLLLYMGILCSTYFAAAKWKPSPKYHTLFSWMTQWIVYVLILLMGMRLGADSQVTENLASIGVQALVMTIFCVGGSIAAVYLLRKFIGINKFGESAASSPNSSPTQRGASAADARNAGFQGALIILLLVVIGALAGHLLKNAPEYNAAFARHSGTLITLALCLMQGCIGADLGMSGKMSSYFRKTGLIILVFPLAAIAGTLLMGIVSGQFLGFSIKESLAISAGFGWYSYAPAVIAGAGEEHLLASAVAFMHNIIRETSAIVLIPLFAKYIGCLEVTSMPGVSAMDICLPIIERSCRQDTIVYAFSNGLFMHVVTSVGVPLIMSL